MKDDEPKKMGGMTVAEAGKKGGQTVRDKYGSAFYEEIGRKGGKKVAERGREFYEQIGKKGGDAVKAKYGSGHHAEIGKKGGEAVKASQEPNFYSEIGKKGGHKVRALIAAGKAAAEVEEKKLDETKVRDFPHNFVQDKHAPRKVGHCDFTYPDGDYCGVEQQKHTVVK